MIKIGLTGGIASGKSTVVRFFADNNIPVIDSDIISREILKKGSVASKKVINAFGKQIALADDEVDRSALGKLIFGDEEAKNKLNAIVHPLVFDEIDLQLEKIESNGADIVVVDLPLLFETKSEKRFDRIWLVYCKDDVRLARLMERDGIDEEFARSKISSQMLQNEKVLLADVVIDNSNGIDATKESFDEQYRKIIERKK